jgi:predicted anti-sigma-YlaC factor YlaD
MNCYPELVLRRFASGELDEPGMGEVLRHVENCHRCRHALRAAEQNVEKQLLTLADQRDWFPPRPRRLKARVFAAVADDRGRRARQAGVRRRHWRMAPVLAAAAVLLLILGTRYLGEPR